MKSPKQLLSKVAIQKGFFPSTINFTAEEADKFLDYVIDQSVLKDHARFVKMAKSTKNVRAIGLGTGRVMWPEAAFDSTKYQTAGTANLIALTSKKARGGVKVHDDDLEDNIEGEAFVDHLLQMIAKQIGNELAEAYYSSYATPDGQTPKDIFDIWNGWRYRILNQTNLVTGSATILDGRSASDFALANGYIAEQNPAAPYNWEFKFSKALKKLASKYKRLGLENFRFFVNDQLEQDYVDSLASRSTIVGDKAIIEGGDLKFGKVPIVGCPLMPTNLPVPVASGGDTTVDADSAAEQKVLNTAATDNFTVGDYVYVFKAGLEYKSEICKIASIQAGISLTMVDNLVWAHAGADAETVKEVTLDGADCMLTHKENFIIGLERDIKMETERKASEESTYFFYSIRSDIAVENLNAVVFIKNLKIR